MNSLVNGVYLNILKYKRKIEKLYYVTSTGKVFPKMPTIKIDGTEKKEILDALTTSNQLRHRIHQNRSFILDSIEKDYVEGLINNLEYLSKVKQSWSDLWKVCIQMDPQEATEETRLIRCELNKAYDELNQYLKTR